jgi:hypothetical protein
MGVFPLTNTILGFSNPPFSRGGNQCAPLSGRTAEVRWRRHPSRSRRAAAAKDSQIDYIPCIATLHASTRGPRIDAPRPASAGRYIRRSPVVRTSEWTVGSAAERGPPPATLRMPAD